MNKARILGILILGFYFLYKSYYSDSGFLINTLIGALTAAGFLLAAFGNFKFRN